MKKFLVSLYLKYKNFKSNILPKYFVGSTFSSSLYYLLFSNKFKREQNAVLKGKLNYLENLNNKKHNTYLLIRNTHRIEKGLLMRPRKEIFALDYIEETVDAFIHNWKVELSLEGSQHKWFFDVLQEYFKVTGNHDFLNQQRKRFLNFIKKNNSSTKFIEKAIPYSRDERKRPEVSFEQFYALTKYRRSVRWFQDKKVPRELVDKAVLAANQSPSACNRQPYQYIIIDDPKLLSEVANLPGGVRGYVEGIKMLVVAIGNLDAYFDERDRHVIYIDVSLANMTFMLALETMGLSSCAINWPDVEKLEERMEKVLGLEKHQRPIMLMAVGYPDNEGKVAYSEKRDLDLLRKYN